MRSYYEKATEALLKENGYNFEIEFKFSKRKWRFDFAFPKQKIAVEIEGEIWTGHGRHSWGKGFISDCEKYNEAQILGWIVLRYPPENIPKVIDDLKRLIPSL